MLTFPQCKTAVLKSVLVVAAALSFFELSQARQSLPSIVSSKGIPLASIYEGSLIRVVKPDTLAAPVRQNCRSVASNKPMNFLLEAPAFNGQQHYKQVQDSCYPDSACSGSFSYLYGSNGCTSCYASNFGHDFDNSDQSCGTYSQYICPPECCWNAVLCTPSGAFGECPYE
jgi:hypothetical protein